MDAWVLLAVKVFFIVAVAAPPILVFIYRWKEVPLRRAEVEAMMDCALKGPDKAACKEAQEALDSNPYISNPNRTFNRYHSAARYVLPMAVLILLTSCSAYIVYSSVRHNLELHGAQIAADKASAARKAAAQQPPSTTPANPAPPLGQNPAPFQDKVQSLVIVMALAGGYVWSVFQICARSRSSELSPDDLYEIDLGLLAAVPVGIAFSLLSEGWGALAAFVASAFPLRDSQRLLRQFAMRKVLQSADADASASRPGELHLGTTIEGLSDQTLARLSELRISTVLDMAYCDPIRVMVQTGFPLPVIIDWVDQSLWALYCGDLKSKIDKLGIRCSLDVCEFVDLHLCDGDGKKRTVVDGANKAALDALAQAMGSDPLLLQDLLFRIYCDPQVAVLRKLWYPHGVPKELKASAAGA
jgi:hypothetical protein